MNTPFDLAKHINTFSGNRFIQSGHSQSYKEFYEQIQQYNYTLRKIGVKENDIVIIDAVSRNDLPAILFSIWLNKAIAFPVNPKFPKRQIEKICEDCAAQFYISDKISNLDCPVEQISFTDFQSNNYNPKFPESVLDLKIPATIILTSGSSGDPKYAAHSLENYLYSAQAVNEYFNISDQSNWLLALPVFHVAGLAIIIRSFLAGATLSIPADDENLTSALHNYKPSYISLVPTQLRRLLESKTDIEILMQCKAVFLGGSAIPQMLINKSIKHDLKLFTSYGLTEMSSTVAIKQVTDGQAKGAMILPIHQVKVSEENEILLKGKSLFCGYWAGRKVESTVTDDGWFPTKDLGGIDKNNRLTVLGRKDNMFISGGENIYPEEIEKHILQIDGIEQAVVIPVENKEFGLRPVAFFHPYRKEAIHSIKVQIGQKLPSFKIPDSFYPWPKNFDKEFKTHRSKFIKLANEL